MTDPPRALIRDVAVHVTDEFDQRLTGRTGREVTTPPMARGEALALAGALLDLPGPASGDGPWIRALAGGRRVVALV